MELKEFQRLALRTESFVDNINIDVQALGDILDLLVNVTEILDGVKKGVFYGKMTKLETSYVTQLSNISRLVEALQWREVAHGHPMATTSGTNLDNVNPRVFHGIVGMVTESGELASALLKSVRNSEHVIDAVNVQEEMNDDNWYQAILNDALGLDAGQGLQNVIDKLRVRYPDKYSDESAENRNLNAEREVLERGVVTIDSTEKLIETFGNPSDYFIASYISGQMDPPMRVERYKDLSARIESVANEISTLSNGRNYIVMTPDDKDDYDLAVEEYAAAFAKVEPPEGFPVEGEAE